MIFNAKKRKADKTEKWFILSFMIIPVISFLLFYVYVNLDAFIMAFQKPEKGELVFAGFENFKWVIDKISHGSTYEIDNLQLAFKNTFITFGIQMIMFFVGMLVSYFIYKRVPCSKAFRIIFYLPTIISALVTSYFYMALMNSDFVPKILSSLHHLDYEMKSSPLSNSDFANKMVLLNFIWLSFPANLILWGGTFARIPDSVLESAKLDGIGWFKELNLIILPMVWPTFVLLITTNLAAIFGATGNVFLLTQGESGTQTVSNWMYQKVQQTSNPFTSDHLYRVSAMGLMLTVVSCAIAIFMRKFLNSRIEEVQF